MATYVVGDVHGCLGALERLLVELPFERGRDRLWLTGDLVNRGPDSLAVLRWAQAASRDLGERFVTVLGNHDLHLLALLAGHGREHHEALLGPVREAKDRDQIEAWLAGRPLLHWDGAAVLVHAGIPPAWKVKEAEERAREAEEVLRDPAARLRYFTSGEPARVEETIYGLTAMRVVTAPGGRSTFAGPPEQAPPGTTPWFDVPNRSAVGVTIVAGHWAALGLRLDETFLGLDTGCVYGGRLTAVRLEDRRVFSVASAAGLG